MKTNDRGFVLVGVLAVMIVLMLLIPALVSWVGHESKWSVKEQKNTTAYNMAEAGVDRGYWKLKSSTVTWANALINVPPADYDFSKTFIDVQGGTYRIRITSGPATGQVTVTAEGRDAANNQVRAVKVVYADLSVPGAIISGGAINQSGSAVVHWGPIMAMNDITLSGSAASRLYPRKLSKQVVRPRDPTNNLDAPNTDNLEWWSKYEVPELPEFDFNVLRASAQATGTLNCDGTSSGGSGLGSGSMIGCNSSCDPCSIVNLYKDPRWDDNYVWFWDKTVTINNPAVIGTVIAMKNLTMTGDDKYNPPPVSVPSTAWQEYRRIDTSGSNQYPADTGGPGAVSATYDIGSCGSGCEGSMSLNDIGFYGFIYVGGNIGISGHVDTYGAVWVEGNWGGTGDTMLFYNDKLKLPQRNVTMSRVSWQEVGPSTATWAP